MAKPVGPVGDLENAGFQVVDDDEVVYDVGTAYALLANAPLPAAVTEEDLA